MAEEEEEEEEEAVPLKAVTTPRRPPTEARTDSRAMLLLVMAIFISDDNGNEFEKEVGGKIRTVRNKLYVAVLPFACLSSSCDGTTSIFCSGPACLNNFEHMTCACVSLRHSLCPRTYFEIGRMISFQLSRAAAAQQQQQQQRDDDLSQGHLFEPDTRVPP